MRVAKEESAECGARRDAVLKCGCRHPQCAACHLNEGLGSFAIGTEEEGQSYQSLISDRAYFHTRAIADRGDDGGDTVCDKVHMRDWSIGFVEDMTKLEPHVLGAVEQL